jgi:hypothetical protein
MPAALGAAIAISASAAHAQPRLPAAIAATSQTGSRADRAIATSSAA